METVWPWRWHSIAAVRPPKPAPTMRTLMPLLGGGGVAVDILGGVGSMGLWCLVLLTWEGEKMATELL